MAADIVIPVYNAPDYLKKCVESVLQFTSAGSFGLILVDDASTNPGVNDVLREIKKRIPAALILKNEQNGGFVVSANRGLAASQNDIVLLNSDTEASPGWLEKLARCAVSRENVATVTPWTNSGTICSAPDFCTDSEIPDGPGFLARAERIEKASPRLYPEIPTGVGFCLYIRRDALNKVGPFDEKTFARGYGEENDFCYRARRAGFVNLLCDDTLIWHKGTASFATEEKNKNVAKAAQILDARYPAERRDTMEFIRRRALEGELRNIRLHTALANGRRNLLFILHMPLPYRPGDSQAGGTQKHVLELARRLSGIYNVFVLWPEKEAGFCVAGFCGETTHELFFAAENCPGDAFGDKAVSCIKTLLTLLQIDLVHIHHTLGLGDGIFSVVKEHGLPLVFTAHDFYMLCGNVNLMKNGVFCGADPGNCRGCEKSRLAVGKKALSQCDAVLAPDESAADILEKFVPDTHVFVVGHGAETTKMEKADAALPGNSRFRAAFVGSINPVKGSGIIRKLIKACPAGEIEWHVFGTVEDKKFKIPRNAAVLHGRYQGEMIVKLLQENAIDLCCFFPMWPETFNFTLTESWLAGVPALGYDIGAIGSRIKKTGLGFTVPFGAGPEEILQKINEIRADGRCTQIKQKLAGYRPESLEEMAALYRDLYEKLLPTKRREAENATMESNRILTQAAENGLHGTETLGLGYAAGLEGAREKIRGKTPRFLADFILYGRYPFKKSLKRLATRLMGRNS